MFMFILMILFIVYMSNGIRVFFPRHNVCSSSQCEQHVDQRISR